MKKAFLIILLIFVMLSPTTVEGQKTGGGLSGYSLVLDAHYGFVIAHHPEIWRLTSGYFPSWEFTVLKQTNGKRVWHYLYNYPEIGLTFRFSSFGGSSYLGKNYSLIPYVNFPFAKHEHFQFGFKVGLGVGYMTKKFDRLENYKNITIGSHFNAAILFALTVKSRLTERLSVNAGLSMFHLSNGSIKIPNYGLNIPTVFCGLTFKINNDTLQFKKPAFVPKKKGKVDFRMMFWAATKQMSHNREDRFMVYVLTGDLSVYYNNSNRILTGYDIINDGSTRCSLESGGMTSEGDVNFTKYGINLAHEWVLDKLSISLALGVYVHNPDESDGIIYDKIGVYYSFAPFLVIGTTLNAQYGKADYLSVGIGINL